MGKLTTVNYEEGLIDDLKNPVEAAAYLNAALEDGSQEMFLMALRDVAKARGIGGLAKQASLNRENLYRILSENGNPQLSNLTTILKIMGLKLAVEVENAA